MSITTTSRSKRNAPWLFFIFQLPQWKASARVSVWRKLQRYGALAWKNAAYVLPHTPSNLEKFQWLAAEVRKHRGEASVAEVARIEGYSDRHIIRLFQEARDRDYDGLIAEMRTALRPLSSRTSKQLGGIWARLNRRLAEVVSLDVFGSAKRKEAEELLRELESASRRKESGLVAMRPVRPTDFRGRVWMTRPRPEVDRVACGWLIKRFIDPKARFVFSSNPKGHPGAVRFDMFEGEFTHLGDECTFERMIKLFELAGRRLRVIAQIVHDADFEDNKFGRPEGLALELVLKGWAKMNWRDDEILRHGYDLYDALYHSIPD